jgi:hypothetical protein
VPEFPNRCVTFKVNRQTAKIHASHATVCFDVETVVFVLAKADQTFLTEGVKPKAACAVIKRFSGEDKKELHGLFPFQIA